jgi:ubiquinone/menaquinone biosynthesis C-methylase UbiE
VRDDYRANYQQIAADHIAHYRSTGNNPWQSGEHVNAVGDATRDYLRRYSAPGDAILDAGCGMGELTVPLTDRERHGIDFAPGYVEIAAVHIQAIVGDLEHLPYPDERFALVVAADILEHVLDLNRVVAELLRVLRPGGVLVVRVPERENLSPYLTPKNPYRFVHLRRFDRASLELLFTRIFDCTVLESSVIRKERIMAVRR